MKMNLIEYIHIILLRKFEILGKNDQGSNEVKELKISMLAHEYEIFKMKLYKFISDMFSRFANIINDLYLLKKLILI